MGKPFRCRLGQHKWKITGKDDDMKCQFCGKEFDDNGPVGDMNKRKWWEPQEGGEGGGA